MTSKIFELFISEEERIFLAIKEAESQGHRLPIESCTSIVETFHRKKNWNDSRFDLRDLGDGCGVHLFRPFWVAEHEHDYIMERRERALARLKASESRKRNRAKR